MTREMESHVLPPSGDIPNSALPLIVARGALPPENRSAEGATRLLKVNGWSGTWVWTVYPFWHFHIRGHEVLACVEGDAEIGFGGEAGIRARLEPGDVVLIPAGVGHKRLSTSPDFAVAGAYPSGQKGDITRPGTMPLKSCLHAVASVPLPGTDPLTGKSGGMLAF